MTTEQHLYITSTRSTSHHLALCGCGQDLDVCAGTHCPRCGSSVVPPKPAQA
jgi:hypothetical protein